MSERLQNTPPDVFPLSFAQRRLLFLHGLDPTGRVHSTTLAFRIEGPFDQEAYRAAVTELARRHEALRTTFPLVDGSPVQLIAPPPDAATAVGFSCAARTADSSAAPPPGFDPAVGPLARFSVAAMGSHWVLVASFHLLAADGWSLRLLFEELAVAYQDAAHGRPAGTSLPPAPEVQYADWSQWHTSRLTRERRTALAAWWRRELADVSTDLDFGPGHRAASAGTGGTVRRILDASAGAALAESARRSGRTMFAVLAAACALVVARRAGRERLVLGLAAANRGRPEVHRTAGFFVDTVALRVDLTGGPTFAALVDRVAAATAAALAHQDLPFEEVVHAVAPVRRTWRTPLVQVNFAYHPARTVAALVLDGCHVAELPPAAAPSGKFGLTVRVTESADGSLDVRAEHDGSLLSTPTAEQVLEAFTDVLAAIPGKWDGPADGLPAGPARPAGPAKDSESPGSPGGGGFFELGGTSLQLLSVHARLRDCLGIDIALSDLYAALAS